MVGIWMLIEPPIAFRHRASKTGYARPSGMALGIGHRPSRRAGWNGGQGGRANRAITEPGSLGLAWGLDRRVSAIGRNPYMASTPVVPVQQRSGDFAQVARYDSRRAPALPRRIAIEPARARIHRRHQHEGCGKTQRLIRPRDRDRAIFERLAHHLQHIARELGKLIEKEI